MKSQFAQNRSARWMAYVQQWREAVAAVTQRDRGGGVDF